MTKTNSDFLKNSDPTINELINQELQRQRDHLELIASENFTSAAVLAAQGSVLTNKYAEGLPGKRYLKLHCGKASSDGRTTRAARQGASDRAPARALSTSAHL